MLAFFVGVPAVLLGGLVSGTGNVAGSAGLPVTASAQEDPVIKARALMREGNWLEASEFLEAAIDEGANTADVHYWLAYSHRRLDRLGSSRNSLHRALDRVREEERDLRIRCWYDLACTHLRLRDPTAALDALERAYRAGLRNPEWLLSDDDLVDIRDDPRFQAVVAAMRLERRTVGLVYFPGCELQPMAEAAQVLEAAHSPGEGLRFELMVVAVDRGMWRRPRDELLGNLPIHEFATAPRPDILLVPGCIDPARPEDLETRVMLSRLAEWAEIVWGVGDGHTLLSRAELLPDRSDEDRSRKFFRARAAESAQDSTLRLLRELLGDPVADATRERLDRSD